MTRHTPTRSRRSVLGAAVALAALATATGCTQRDEPSAAQTPTTAPSTTVDTPSPTTAPAPPTTPADDTPTPTSTTAATPATAPATTDVAPTTTEVLPGRELVFSMSDGALVFTITTDEIAGTARVLVQPEDGSPSPRWEAVVPWVDEPNVSGHRPLDGLPVEPVSGGAQVEANLQLVQDYVTTALVEGRWADVDRFFRDGRYVLHGPLFADGVESVRTFFVGLRDAGVPFTITGTSLWMAAGDFVLAINRHDAGGVSTAYWDLWRVADGAIAEHWDAIVTVPADVADAWFAGSGPPV